MTFLKTIQARYLTTFATLTVVAIALTLLGIQKFVAPQLEETEIRLVEEKVDEIAQAIQLNLARIESQSRAITQTTALLQSEQIDAVLPGLIDQYGNQKVFGGGIWPLPNMRTPGQAKHSTFYHRDAQGRLMACLFSHAPVIRCSMEQLLGFVPRMRAAAKELESIVGG